MGRGKVLLIAWSGQGSLVMFKKSQAEIGRKSISGTGNSRMWRALGTFAEEQGGNRAARGKGEEEAGWTKPGKV